MHTIEPFYSWKNYYSAENDKKSPFYKRTYSEFECRNTIYNYYIHPQWDEMGSSTLYLKILYTNYESGFTVLELMGEWNDCLHNDIMYLKRNVIEVMQDQHINKFILIGENIMNFHSSDDSYYQEWYEDNEDGWIAGINFRPHVLEEFGQARLDYYIAFGGSLDKLNWRTFNPLQLFRKVEGYVSRILPG